MSSPFNYELNEHRIKILMQDAELESDSEQLWNKFESIEPTIGKKSPSVQTHNYNPKFNLRINNSVILPVIFIILIAGLSAILFSFIDFKKKKNIDKEIPLVANPENFKRTDQVSAKANKPTDTTAIPLKIVAAINISDSNSIAAVVTKKTETTDLIKTNLRDTIVFSVDSSKVPKTVTKKKKTKKKKRKTEELPIIKTINDLNENANEPELKLDLK